MRRRSLSEIVSITSEMGYGAIEISSRPNEKHVDVEDILADGGKEVREIVNEGGLGISALTCHLNLMDPERGPGFAEHFDKVIRAASKLEVPVITAVTGSRPGKADEDAFRSMAEVWRPRIDLAEDLGIKIAFETFPPNLAYNIPTIEKAFEAMGSDNIGLNFDPSHAVWQGIDNYRIIREFSDRIFHAHAKDTEILEETLAERGVTSKGWWRFRVPGWGSIDWRRIITSLKASGYDSVLSFEHEDKTFNDLEGTLKNYQYLEGLV
jgi:sugar phosphate isomerase/epimerase